MKATWRYLAAATLAMSAGCSADGGSPYERTDRIRTALGEAQEGLQTSRGGLSLVETGEVEHGTVLLNRGIATLNESHGTMAVQFDAMRGMHQGQCGYELEVAIDAFEVGITRIEIALAALEPQGQDEGADPDGIDNGLRAVRVALTDIENVLPCIEYEHSDDAKWRDDAARL